MCGNVIYEGMEVSRPSGARGTVGQRGKFEFAIICAKAARINEHTVN